MKLLCISVFALMLVATGAHAGGDMPDHQGPALQQLTNSIRLGGASAADMGQQILAQPGVENGQNSDGQRLIRYGQIECGYKVGSNEIAYCDVKPAPTQVGAPSDRRRHDVISP